jgi:4-oxalocrotonate tautomerase
MIYLTVIIIRFNIYVFVFKLIREIKMPIVHVNVWEGFGKVKTKIVIQKITKVFIDLDIPKQAIDVIVHEIPKSHWGIGGEPASEKFEDMK